MLYRWREQLEAVGREGLKPYLRVHTELRRLELGNLALKNRLRKGRDLPVSSFHKKEVAFFID